MFTRAFVVAAVILPCFPSPGWSQQITLQLTLHGREIEGTPISWDEQRVFMLGRDGHLWDFAPNEAEQFRKSANGFQPLSHGELRGLLMREFGRGYEVSGAGQYVVVHPVGQRDVWAPRFDELYRSFMRYFAVRGIPVEKSQFPLIAIVFPSQGAFLQYARQQGDNVGPGVLGYYSTQTNRILLYDLTNGSDTSDWSENASTIIHEAAHQSAFNTNVHSRQSLPPRWLAEGLGTLFEAPGVWNSRLHPQLSDRINQGRLDSFRRHLPKRPQGALAAYIASDRPFGQNPDAAYAEAWALTMYLVENEPLKYQEYLRLTSSRAAFSTYTSPERVRDFVKVFGTDLNMFEARMLRFISTLK